jgi:hypothetical protein
MHGQATQLTDVDYICVAADLLTEMLSELQSLERENRCLELAMAIAGHDFQQRLVELCGIIDVLALSQDNERRAALCQRAKSLIFRLAVELEDLTLAAELDQRRIIH